MIFRPVQATGLLVLLSRISHWDCFLNIATLCTPPSHFSICGMAYDPSIFSAGIYSNVSACPTWKQNRRQGHYFSSQGSLPPLILLSPTRRPHWIRPLAGLTTATHQASPILSGSPSERQLPPVYCGLRQNEKELHTYGHPKKILRP